MPDKRKTPAHSLKGLILAALILLFSSFFAFSQKPAGIYTIKVKMERQIDGSPVKTVPGTTLYLKKANWAIPGGLNGGLVIDSAVVDKSLQAKFRGLVYPLDLQSGQDSVFTAGQYFIADHFGVRFSFFYSPIDGGNFRETFTYRQGLWWKNSVTKRRGKENEIFLAAEKALYDSSDATLNSLMLQARKQMPGSLVDLYLRFLLKPLTSSDESQLPDIADERLYYTDFGKRLVLDIFLDKFKFSKEGVRNMAIDYLMENRYLTAPKMRAAVAMEIFRRYSSSVVMGCEGSAVYAAEKYILNNEAVSPAGKAEAAWYVTVNKGTLVGAKAPELKLKDTSGVERSIKDLMGDHSIIYFYSDDCNYCKEETPRLVSLLDSWNEFPINIAAVYTGTDANAWKKYIGRHFQTTNPYITWIHLADLDRESNFPVDYGVVSTPKMFLLDESLKIKGRGILTPTLTAMLKEQAEEDSKAYSYLSRIFPAEELSPEAATDLKSRKDAVDKIYDGVKDSESFSRLMRQAFTYLFFCGYSPNTQTSLYLGQKYVLDMPERWDDTVFVSSVESILKAANMNAPGSKAENITLYDIADNPADLLPSDGKMKVLYFYRTGCEVCKETLLVIKDTWKKYGKKVSFTGIFAGENTGEFRKFVASNNLEFRQLYAKDNLSELGGKYYIEAVPLILVIDKDGTIIFKGTSAEILPEILK